MVLPGGDAHFDLAHRVGHRVLARPRHALRQQADAVCEDGAIVARQRLLGRPPQGGAVYGLFNRVTKRQPLVWS